MARFGTSTHALVIFCEVVFVHHGIITGCTKDNVLLLIIGVHLIITADS